jgi:outer membrane protein
MNVVKQIVIKTLISFAAVLVLVSGASAADLKIGVVNLPLLMDRSPQTKQAFVALQEEFAPRQRDMLAKQKDLQTKDDNY